MLSSYLGLASGKCQDITRGGTPGNCPVREELQEALTFDRNEKEELKKKDMYYLTL